MGVCHHAKIVPALFQAAQTAGFSAMRSTLQWSSVEVEKGSYDFRTGDAWMTNATANGIKKAILLLAYGNCLYAGTGSDGKCLPPTSDEAIAAYGRFAAAAVQHFAAYQPQIEITYEIWNEPNNAMFWGGAPNVDQYDAVLRAGLAGVQRDPTLKASAMTGGLAAFGHSYANIFLRDLYSFFSSFHQPQDPLPPQWIGIHPYRRNGPETVTDHLVYGKWIAPHPDLAVSEWGYSSTWYGPVLPNSALRDGHDANALHVQAKLAVRQIMTEWLIGSPLAMYFTLADSGTDGTDQEQNFGLLDPSGQDKPAMTAVRTMSRQLDGRNIAGVVPVPSDSSAYVVKFEEVQTVPALRPVGGPAGPRGLDTLYMLWETMPGSSTEVIAPLGTTGVDMMGQPLVWKSDGAQLRYTLHEAQGPIYVHVPSGAI
jgi:hypothetical protein